MSKNDSVKCCYLGDIVHYVQAQNNIAYRIITYSATNETTPDYLYSVVDEVRMQINASNPDYPEKLVRYISGGRNS